MKNENKVTIKNRKIMIHKFSRYLLTLVALLAMTTGAWADPNILTPTITGDREFFESVTITMTCTSQNADIYYTKNGLDPLVLPDNQQIEYKGPITLTETTTIMARAFDGNDWSAMVEVTFTKVQGPIVTLNEAKTTASFEMPAYDATVSYELVRDMAINVNAVVTDRIRIQKENNAYVAVTATELIPAVSDKISGTAVAMTATTDYTAQLQKKTEGDTPTWADATTLSVGTFRYVITGTGLYDGKITTNEFQLFEGYEVTIPAGEYITYYKDENLTLDKNETEAKLYTISSVSETEAVLSSELTVAKANMPILVFNGSEKTKSILLIPTEAAADEVTAATQFVGTLEATTIPASATGADNYALNGYAFVWVKTAIEVGANKCWLHIASQPAGARASTRSITGGNGTTGIDAIENVTIDNEGWYDLNGRKLQSAPNRKGIYIHNGRKVVVH